RNVLARAGVPPARERAALELALVPAPTPRRDPCLRFLHCRHRLAAAAVRAVLRLDRDASDRVRRLHAQPRYGLDDAASAQPAADLRSPPPRARAPRLHAPLQPAPLRPAASSPSARPATARSPQRNRSFADSDRRSVAGQTPRPPRGLLHEYEAAA